MNNRTQEEIMRMKIETGLLKRYECTFEENKQYSELLSKGGKLPDGVYRHGDLGEFYEISDPLLTEAEKQEYIQLLSLKNLITIKKCAVFFTVLAVISLICAALALLK